jgi:beta-glucosidase
MNALLIVAMVIAALVIVYIVLVLSLRDRGVNQKFDFAKLKQAPWRFGKDFLWGSATASHQIEGNCTNNNWYQFESAVDAQGKPRILNGQKAGLCCDGWNLYKEDVQLMKALSLNAYRFSVEWSKIEPKQGEFDQSALDHYEKEVDEMLANGIEPMITLHHFSNPIWFEDKGAFLQDDSPEIFTRFVERVVNKLGPKVKFWCTINEPAIYAVLGYFNAEFPPALNDAVKAARVFRNMLLAHTAAYNAVKKIRPDAQVGLVVHVALFDPPNQWSLVDLLIARMLNNNMNNSHFDYLVNGKFDFNIPGMVSEKYRGGQKDAFDFIGLNYYTNHFRVFKPFAKEQFTEITRATPDKLTDMGWAIYPEGMYRSLKLIGTYTSKPIYIAENGIADRGDTKRAKYIEDHLLVINKAIADGMNVKGYFYWSLMDNFEWAHGFDKGFGLYSVDLATRKRTLYEGSRKLTEIIKASA